MDRIFPGGKDTICRAFNSSVEIAEIPPVDDMRVVHYDEQQIRKKQLRTDRGINNQLKLSAMKRTGMLKKPEKTLLEIFLKFIPFMDLG